ncbi:hypothetical protein QG071_04490 [Kingella kingae]|uniref:plasmid fertility inhibition factor family protein n=2 Tax=Kingella kingae TaxID=504 RepID=UPI0007065130|nr:hypothetical protein [Kingella kingae]MDK4555309.1 hypothetical protein [Kingella kingae]MDK4576192.1 hypothetical protein [Kingella kingae]MDK4582246.1 hypothetical protein [Kingella kingae]MDK4584388.1 hypothetical protein [Kingella kingae]MDK4588357.1 hypothetical protein [Kingella kingae]
MNLNWDIHYQLFSNCIYPIDLKLIFFIPLTHNTVYMQYNLVSEAHHWLVILDTQKFIQAWRTSQNDERFPNYHLGDEQFWRSDSKFHSAEAVFNKGLGNPVHIATEITCDGALPTFNIRFGNSFTRTLWLLANHADYIPIATQDFDVAENFQRTIGRENCAIYARADLYAQWWQQNQHLFPQVPDDLIANIAQSNIDNPFDI